MSIGYLELGALTETQFAGLYNKVRSLDGKTAEQRLEERRIREEGFKRQQKLHDLVLREGITPETDKITFQKFVTIDGQRVNIT